MQPFPVVSNAGPLIYLGVLNRFHLLRDHFQDVCIPEAVYQEVVIRGESQPGAIPPPSAAASDHRHSWRVRQP